MTAPGEWLDAPDGDGYWRFNCGGASNIYMVHRDLAVLHGEVTGTPLVSMPRGWWVRVPDAPTPPALPLPRERQGVLTVKVRRAKDCSVWLWELFVDGEQVCTSTGLFDTAANAAIAARAFHGIEPTVEVSE